MSLPFSRLLFFLFLGSVLVLLTTACGNTSTVSQPAQTVTAGTTKDIPTPTATTIPTAMPTQATSLSLKFSCGGSKDGVTISDMAAKVCVYTQPGAQLTIRVSFCNGKPDPGSALQGTFTADKTGFYMWNWKPQPDCKGQPIWSDKVDVTAQLNGQSTTLTSMGMA